MKLKRITLKNGLKVYKFSMSPFLFEELNDDYCGLCLKCGEINGQCEPDARKYKCQNCSKRSVYGVSELLLMGLIDIIE